MPRLEFTKEEILVYIKIMCEHSPEIIHFVEEEYDTFVKEYLSKYGHRNSLLRARRVAITYLSFKDIFYSYDSQNGWIPNNS